MSNRFTKRRIKWFAALILLTAAYAIAFKYAHWSQFPIMFAYGMLAADLTESKI